MPKMLKKIISRNVTQKYPQSTFVSMLPNDVMNAAIWAMQSDARAAGVPEDRISEIGPALTKSTLAALVKKADEGNSPTTKEFCRQYIEGYGMDRVYVSAIPQTQIETSPYYPQRNSTGNSMTNKMPIRGTFTSPQDLNVGVRMETVKTDELKVKKMYSVLVGEERKIFKTKEEAIEFAENKIDDAMLYEHHQMYDSKKTVHESNDKLIGIVGTKYRDENLKLGSERIWMINDDTSAKLVNAYRKTSGKKVKK